MLPTFPLKALFQFSFSIYVILSFQFHHKDSLVSLFCIRSNAMTTVDTETDNNLNFLKFKDLCIENFDLQFA